MPIGTRAFADGGCRHFALSHFIDVGIASVIWNDFFLHLKKTETSNEGNVVDAEVNGNAAGTFMIPSIWRLGLGCHMSIETKNGRSIWRGWKLPALAWFRESARQPCQSNPYNLINWNAITSTTL
jgi:hypothetical protein